MEIKTTKMKIYYPGLEKISQNRLDFHLPKTSKGAFELAYDTEQVILEQVSGFNKDAVNSEKYYLGGGIV